MDLSAGGWQSELDDIVVCTTSGIPLDRAGFLRAIDRGLLEQKTEDEKVAIRLHGFLGRLLAARTSCMSQSRVVHPMSFARLLSDDRAVIRARLGQLESDWRALLALETVMQTEPDALKLWRHLLWPAYHWVRRTFLCLEEMDWEGLPGFAARDLEEWCEGWTSQKICEDAFRVLRARGESHSQEKISRPTRWATVLASNLLHEYDADMPPVTTAARLVASRCTLDAAGTFEPQKDKGTLPEALQGECANSCRGCVHSFSVCSHVSVAWLPCCYICVMVAHALFSSHRVHATLVDVWGAQAFSYVPLKELNLDTSMSFFSSYGKPKFETIVTDTCSYPSMTPAAVHQIPLRWLAWKSCLPCQPPYAAWLHRASQRCLET